MITELSPNSKSISGREVTLRTFVGQHNAQLFCFTFANQLILWAGEIASPEIALLLKEVIAKLNVSRSLCFLSYTPAVEWEKLESDANRLAEMRLGVLNMPTFDQSISEEPPEYHLELYHHLEQLQNMEGWLHVSQWINELMQKTLGTFLPTMVDEYQLEAKLKDFDHEVKSVLLRETRMKIGEIIPKANAAQSRGELEGLARELLRAREKEFDLMRDHVNTLYAVEKGIVKVEKAHPELLELKQKVNIYQSLLNNEYENELHWIPRFLLSQLLCSSLGITPVVVGDERKHLVFALRAALSLVEDRFSREEVLQMILHFDDTDQKMTKTLMKEGIESLKGNQLECVLYFFKECFWHCFTFLLGASGERMSVAMFSHPDLLRLIPLFVKEGEEVLFLVEYHPRTGEPAALTDEAREFFTWQ